jgi:hypothetical protein
VTLGATKHRPNHSKAHQYAIQKLDENNVLINTIINKNSSNNVQG